MVHQTPPPTPVLSYTFDKQMGKKGRAIEYDLPEDVLIDVLSRVPAKSLLRFKSVSKYWYSLILNPNFISLHHSRAQPYCCVSLIRNQQWSMCLLPDQTSIHDLDLSFTMPHLIKDFVYRGCCNDLMCLSENSNIVICNPATRECRLLPQSPYHTWDIAYVGFAFDSKTNDYIVVRFATVCQITFVDHKIHIYSMSADSWKEITTTVPYSFTATYRYFQSCTFSDGIFYWLSYDSSTCVHLIDALNTVEGLFEQRSMPGGLSFGRWIDPCLLNDSPALIQQKYDDQQGETWFDVWLMDKYGVKEFWTKKCTIGPLLGNHIPFGFWPNSEVLLTKCKNGQILSYDHSTQDIKEYNQLCDFPELMFITQVFPYAESLVSVKR